MHSRTIDMHTWADVHERLRYPIYGEVGPASVTTGEHPEFGTIIAVQTVEGLTLISELPFGGEIARRFGDRDEFARSGVSASSL